MGAGVGSIGDYLNQGGSGVDSGAGIPALQGGVSPGSIVSFIGGQIGNLIGGAAGDALRLTAEFGFAASQFGLDPVADVQFLFDLTETLIGVFSGVPQTAKTQGTADELKTETDPRLRLLGDYIEKHLKMGEVLSGSYSDFNIALYLGTLIYLTQSEIVGRAPGVYNVPPPKGAAYTKPVPILVQTVAQVNDPTRPFYKWYQKRGGFTWKNLGTALSLNTKILAQASDTPSAGQVAVLRVGISTASLTQKFINNMSVQRALDVMQLLTLQSQHFNTISNPKQTIEFLYKSSKILDLKLTSQPDFAKSGDVNDLKGCACADCSDQTNPVSEININPDPNMPVSDINVNPNDPLNPLTDPLTALVPGLNTSNPTLPNNSQSNAQAQGGSVTILEPSSQSSSSPDMTYILLGAGAFMLIAVALITRK